MQVLQSVGQNADFFRASVLVGTDIGTEIGDESIFQFCIETILRAAPPEGRGSRESAGGKTEQRRRGKAVLPMPESGACKLTFNASSTSPVLPEFQVEV